MNLVAEDGVMRRVRPLPSARSNAATITLGGDFSSNQNHTVRFIKVVPFSIVFNSKRMFGSLNLKSSNIIHVNFFLLNFVVAMQVRAKYVPAKKGPV